MSFINFNALISFFITIFLCGGVIFLSKYKNIIGKDNNEGIQKVHLYNSYRIGGFLILLSTVITLLITQFSSYFIFLILLCLLPLITISLYEDFTLKASIKLRFWGIFLSSLALVYFTNFRLTDVQFSWANYLLNYYIISILVTALGITILANAWNFIDGLNFLASGLGSIVLLFISILSWQQNLHDIFILTILFSFSTMGFSIINFFTGKIFLGDTGSLLIGCLIGWSGVAVSQSELISSWLIFYIILYPAIELIVSFFRRIIYGKSPIEADNLHLHSLFYKYIKNRFRNLNPSVLNSLSGGLIFLLASIPLFCAYFFDLNKNIILTLIAIYFIFYLIIYFSLNYLVKSKTKFYKRI